MARDVSDNLPLNPREFLVLLALVDGSQHGYGILKTVAAESADEVALDPANLYRMLRRLRRDGLVTEATPRAGPRSDRRNLFALTGLGRDVVKAEARRVDRLAAAVRAKKLVSRSGVSR